MFLELGAETRQGSAGHGPEAFPGKLHRMRGSDSAEGLAAGTALQVCGKEEDAELREGLTLMVRLRWLRWLKTQSSGRIPACRRLPDAKPLCSVSHRVRKRSLVSELVPGHDWR